jgi:hypothetical protein
LAAHAVAGPTKPKSGVVEYVGAVSGFVGGAPAAGSFAVAVVVDKSGNVDAYACDGLGGKYAFTGKAQHGQIDLPSADGQAQLTATVNGSNVNGKLSIAGVAQDFTLKKAKLRGGLYTFDIKETADEGIVVTAASPRGNTITATAKPGQQPPIKGTLTSVNGSKREYVIREPRVAPPDQLSSFDSYRVVVLNNGAGRGNPTISAIKLIPATSQGTLTLKATTLAIGVVCTPFTCPRP